MRLLHLDCGREMRGGQWQVLLLLEGLRERGVESVLAVPPSSPLAAEARRRDLGCEAISATAVLRLSRSADVVHCHDARSHTLAALASRAPFVVSRRVAFPAKRSALSRWKYRRPALFFAVSRFVAGRLLEAGVDAGKVRVVYDGVPLPPITPHGEEKNMLVAVETGDPDKNPVLVQAAAKLAGLPLCLSRDLTADLRRARLFVYLSREEGLGSAALLALAYGVPVVASRVDGLPEVVRHEETGLLVNNDAGAVAEALRRLWDDAALAARLGENGRAMVEREFTATLMVESSLDGYRELLTARRAHG